MQCVCQPWWNNASLTFILTTQSVWVKMDPHQPVRAVVKSACHPKSTYLATMWYGLVSRGMGRSLESKINPIPRWFLAVKTYRTKREISTSSQYCQRWLCTSKRTKVSYVPSSSPQVQRLSLQWMLILSWLPKVWACASYRCLCWSVCQTKKSTTVTACCHHQVRARVAVEPTISIIGTSL